MLQLSPVGLLSSTQSVQFPKRDAQTETDAGEGPRGQNSALEETEFVTDSETMGANTTADVDFHLLRY